MTTDKKDPPHDDSSTDTGKNEDLPDGSGNKSSDSEEDTASGGPA